MANRESKGVRQQWKRWLRSIPAVGALLTALAVSSAAHAEQRPRLASLEDFGKCTNAWDADTCLEALHAYVRAHPAQAFDAGKVVTLNLNHWAAIPFFDQALARKADPVRCGEARLALAVTSALALPSDSYAKIVGAARSLGTKCWPQLQAPLTQALEAGDASGYLIANACPLLAEKKQTSKACEQKPENKAQPAAAPPAALQWDALDPKQLGVENSAKVYRGDEGRRVTLVKVKGKDYYLIKFEGFRGPWNGKVVLHKESSAGSGYDYWTPLGKDRNVSLVARKSYGSFTYEVYPEGDKGPFYVGYDEKGSQAASAKAILSEFAK